MLLLVPALQVMLFGFAIHPHAQDVRVAIAADNPKAAEGVVERLKQESTIHLLPGVKAPGGAEAELTKGNALIAIEVSEPKASNDQPIRIIVDATNAGLAEAAALRIKAIYWQSIAASWDENSADHAPVIEQRYNPDVRADWTFLPALIGVTMMISMVMLGCLSLAREREIGTWEGLLSLPISRLELLAGKALPYAVLGSIQGALVLTISILLFDLPTRGAVPALIAILPFFATAHFLIGYLISARASTQIGALQGAVAFYLPAMLLSGFLYPFETLPRWAQMLGSVFPLTHFVAAARDILLRGQSFAEVAPSLAPILVALVACILAGCFVQNRQLD